METSISSRCSKLFQILTGKQKNKRDSYRLFDWEPLLDAFLLFIESQCDYEAQKRDKHISNFFKKYKQAFDELKSLRVTKSDFNVIKTIGRGHFGEVYVVKEKSTGDVYAMKVLKKSSTLSQDETSFYEEERDVMAFANSLWVTSLQYSFQDSESLYFIMEFHPGGDLVNLIARYENGMMDEDSARFYLAEIVMAINSVHEIGYVHRDIKPENVLLDITGHVKLADFGSAARLKSGNQTFCKMPVGTPEYVAPEILTCMNSGGGVYGVECDWWSLGVMSYEVMCGSLPFEADGILELYNKIMNFKDSLEFYDDVELSETAKSLICSLITDSKTRIDFNGLAVHPFFDKIDWTTLKNIPPPYIPQLRGPLDTSHFDDFKSSQRTAPPSFSSKSSISNDLPFIGFTFTRPLYLAFNDDSHKVSTASTPASVSSLVNDHKEEELRRNNSVVKQPMENLNMLNENLKRKNELTEKKLKDLQDDYNKINTQLNDKSNYITEMENKIAHLTTSFDSVNIQLQDYIGYSDMYKEAKKSMEEQRLEVSTLKGTIKQLEITNQNLQSSINSLQDEYDLIKKKYCDSEEYWKEYERIQAKSQADLKNITDELRARVDKLTSEYKEKERLLLDDLSIKVSTISQLESKIMAMRNENVMNESENLQHQETINNMRIKEIEDIKKLLSQAVSDNDKYKLKIMELDDVINQNQNEISSKKIEILELNQRFSTIKDNFDLTQNKLNEYKTINSNYESELQQIKQRNIQMDSELQSVRNLLEDEKSNSAKLKSKYLKHKEKYRLKNTRLMGSLNELEGSLTDLTNTKSNLNNENTKLKNELENLKKEYDLQNDKLFKSQTEMEKLVSLISAQKTSNFALSQELSANKKQMQDITEQHEEEVSVFQRQVRENWEQIVKLREIKSQQEKLIDFLRESLTSKKGKNKLDKFTSTPSVVPPSPQNFRRARDLELQLEKEREQYLKLNKDFLQLKEENKALKFGNRSSKKPDDNHNESVVSSTKNVKLIDEESNHSMQSTLNLNPNICNVCQNPLQFGRPTSKCSTCGINVHSSCEHSISVKCDSSESVSLIEMDPTRIFSIHDHKSDVDSKVIRDWLSVLVKFQNNKGDWQRNYLFIYSNVLTIATGETNDSEVLCDIELNNENSRIDVHPSVRSFDIISFTPSSFVPFIFGIEISKTVISGNKFLSTCIRSQSTSLCGDLIYIMAPSLEVKRLWVLELQKVVKSYKSNSKLPFPSVITKFDPINTRSFRNIVPLNTDSLLLSSADGVYFFSLSDRQLSPCTPNTVNCWSLQVISTVLFGIVGLNRSVVQLHTDKFKNITKLSKAVKFNITTFHQIEDAHILSTFEKDQNHHLLICKSNEVLCFKIDGSSSHKIFSLPCSHCTPFIFYNNGKIIFNEEKILVYDISKAEKRNFFDSEDKSLAFIIYGSTDENNFPMNIFLINNNRKSIEYLVCFAEFGVIVNENGRRSHTENILWSSSPISFYFTNHILYVCHQPMIEMIDFRNSHSNYSDQSLVTRRYVWNSKILGSTHNGDGIYVSTVENDLKISLSVCYFPALNDDHKNTHTRTNSEQDGNSGSSTSAQNPSKITKFFGKYKFKSDSKSDSKSSHDN